MGSDLRGIPLPVADTMESLFNSTFDHRAGDAGPVRDRGRRPGTAHHALLQRPDGGNPPLFMDFRKVWEKWELDELARSLGVGLKEDEAWAAKGLVDGDNSGSASFDWAAGPGVSIEEIMARVSMRLQTGTIFREWATRSHCLAGRVERDCGAADILDLERSLRPELGRSDDRGGTRAVRRRALQRDIAGWPHTFVVPRYATMYEYKHYPPANHLHMVQGLSPARLEYWMDLNNVLSASSWAARPTFIEGVDRPVRCCTSQTAREQREADARQEDLIGPRPGSCCAEIEECQVWQLPGTVSFSIWALRVGGPSWEDSTATASLSRTFTGFQTDPSA